MALCAGVIAPLPSSAQQNPAEADSQYVDQYRTLLQQDGLLLSIGWRLARANVSFCKKVRASIGMQLVDAASFSDAVSARLRLKLNGDFGVGGVAMAGPAQRAGLADLREIMAIDSRPVTELTRSPPGDYRRALEINEHIAALLAKKSRLEVGGTDRNGQMRRVAVAAEAICASRFEVVTDSTRARADGNRVLIGQRMIEKYGDTPFFPAIVAHELAHNLLGHADMLSKEGRSNGQVRHCEREADRLTVWLLANAGHDPTLGLRLMNEYVRTVDFGFLDFSHDAWDERVEIMEEEIAIIEGLRAKAGDPIALVDWSERFPMSRDEAKPRR